MGDFFNHRISTVVGLIVILLVSSLLGWVMVRAYANFMNERFESIQIK